MDDLDGFSCSDSEEEIDDLAASKKLDIDEVEDVGNVRIEFRGRNLAEVKKKWKVVKMLWKRRNSSRSLVAVDEGIFQFLSYIFEIWTKFKTNEKDILLWLVCTGDQIKVQNQP